TLQFLSTSTSRGVEEVNAALGRPVWYQLYAPSMWAACEQLLRRVEKAGCSVIALTVDNTTGRNSETYLRTRPKDLTACAGCHKGGQPGPTIADRRMYDGIDMKGVTAQNPAMDWTFVDRLRQGGEGKVIIQGSDTPEDAAPADDHGIPGSLVAIHR